MLNQAVKMVLPLPLRYRANKKVMFVLLRIRITTSALIETRAAR